MKYLTIGEAAYMLDVTEQTLRNWDNLGKFTPHHKSQAGTRYYTEDQINAFLGLSKNNKQSQRMVIGYCRVSSHKQKDDLERQIENVKMYCIAKGYRFNIITDVGSGINYTKPGLTKLIDMIVSRQVDKVVVLYKDRLIRFGYELIENICGQYDTQIEIIDNTEKTSEQELVEDLVQIITVFACKLHGKRAKKTKELMESLCNDKEE